METLTTTNPRVYLLQMSRETTLEDGRSKSDHNEQAWVDNKQAIQRLLMMAKNTLEDRAMKSLDDPHWGGVSLEIRKIDNDIVATLIDYQEFETEHVSYVVKPLEILGNYEI